MTTFKCGAISLSSVIGFNALPVTLGAVIEQSPDSFATFAFVSSLTLVGLFVAAFSLGQSGLVSDSDEKKLKDEDRKLG